MFFLPERTEYFAAANPSLRHEQDSKLSDKELKEKTSHRLPEKAQLQLFYCKISSVKYSM